MHAQTIPLSQILVPADYRENRKFKPAVVEKIAESVSILGLLQPIGVSPLDEPVDGFTHELAYGEHRLSAVRDHLKEEAIQCTVFPEFDDNDKAIARVVENLYRNEPSREQFLINVRKWGEYYEARHSDVIPGFATVVAGVTGQSKRSAERSVKHAMTFTPDQITAMTSKQVGVVEMDALAGINDKAAREQAVNLVASGTPVAEAVASVAGFDATTEDAVSQVILGQIDSLKRLVMDLGGVSGNKRLQAVHRSLTAFEWAVVNRKEAELSDAVAGFLRN